MVIKYNIKLLHINGVNEDHINNFIIIPIDDLIENGIISKTDENGEIIKFGQTSIMLPPKSLWNTEEGIEYNWISGYANKFELLKEGLLE